MKSTMKVCSVTLLLLQVQAGQSVGVARSVSGSRAGTTQIMMATAGSVSSAGVARAGGQTLMVQAGTGGLARAIPGQLVMASSGQLRAAGGGMMVVTTTAAQGSGGGVIMSQTGGAGGLQATRQHYVISGSGTGGSPAQILALQPGQSMRPGQIVQVAGTGQSGQIVQVAGAGSGQGGQIVQVAAAGTGQSGQIIQVAGAGGNQTGQIVQVAGTGTGQAGQIVQVAGGGQHQIVVSNSGQIMLQPPTSKQM